MSKFDDIKQSLTDKGYMPTSVSINGNLNAVVIKTGYALPLFSRLRNLGSEVSFNKADDAVLVYDEPCKFFKCLEAL